MGEASAYLVEQQQREEHMALAAYSFPFAQSSQSAVASYKDSDTRVFRCKLLNCQNSVPLNAVPPTTLQLQLKGYSKNTGGGAKDREVLLNSVIQKKLAKQYIENIGVQYVKKLHRYYIYMLFLKSMLKQSLNRILYYILNKLQIL